MFAEIADLFLTQGDSYRTPRQLDVLMMISKAVDLVEGRPFRHGLRIALLCERLADLAGLPQQERSGLIQAALLHDVGLLSLTPDMAPRLPPLLPEKTLLAGHVAWQHGLTTWPMPLHPSLTAQMQNHPLAAAGVLGPLRISRDVIAIIEAHHECWNGQGYPAGLNRDQIPLGARLLAMADVLEHLMPRHVAPEHRVEAVRAFFNSPMRNRFDPALLALPDHLFADPWWFKQLFSKEAEQRLHQSAPTEALHPSALLTAIDGLSQWVDDWTANQTAGHSRRVAERSARLALVLGVGKPQAGQLVVAGLLHNIGHLGLPINLLNKPDPLTQADWNLVHQHPQWSAEVVASLPGFDTIALWIGEHHERMNGSGYPGSCKGVGLSIAARLLGLCDAFEALTHPRAYRGFAYGVTDALALMAEQRGRLFDPRLFQLLREDVMHQTAVV